MEITINKLNVPIVHRNKRIYNNDITSLEYSSGSGSGVPVAGEYLPLVGGTITGDLAVNGSLTINELLKIGTVLVANLNADLLDGKHASEFMLNINVEEGRLLGRADGEGSGQPYDIRLGNGLGWDANGMLEATATGGDFLPLSGGTVTGDLTINGTTNLNAVTKVGLERVVNLNADMLDGYHATGFSLSTHNHDTLYEPIIGLSSLRLMGRYSAGAGAWQPITIGSGLDLSTGGVLTATGGSGGDNYEAWNVNVSIAGEPTIMPITSINAAGTYKTVRFAEGNNMVINASSQANNTLALTFNANLTNNSTTRTTDLALTNANTYYTVSSISLPSAGTYFIMGQMAVSNTTLSSSVVTAKLHISTTNYSSASATVGTSYSIITSLSMHTIVTVGADTTITMSAAANTLSSFIDSTVTNNAAGATTTKLSYIKLS